ncbi:ABC transporter substrate-binding protein [Citreimonas salinaria]|uniref:Amino acid/amide ABC transporter substrate-binding protein, HAAT family n=1 Tax=Citreimonas salinaria TaxID=321339 RepID=A0A1H3L5F6_9RHOB|nr:ABC transporter substrate-binding protein [Citreimonas salinaria]SDY59115.1 amino acid/amide ABC transporter substrate-binding protein, HAAT family [Citreimonas salinaria]
MRLSGLCAGVLLCLGAFGASAQAMQDRWRVYLDADFTHAPAVAQGIEAGILAALDHHGAAGDITILTQDHRGNSRRSLDTMRTAASDPLALAVVGGMQSPPYLTYNADINALGIPVLLAWASAAPITRSAPAVRNWMFRVSVDDRSALPYLAGQALAAGCRRPASVVVDTPWGIGSAAELTRQFAILALQPSGLWRIPLGAGQAVASGVAKQMGEADCVVLVVDTLNAASLLRELAQRDRPPRVFAHWGIFGDPDLYDGIRVPLARIDLRVLGSCALRRAAASGGPRGAAANIVARRGDVPDFGGLPAPHAFFHGFDVAALLIAAYTQARAQPDFDAGPAARRAVIRRALYGLDEPVRGFVKTYRAPFSPFHPHNPDGHEALTADDLCMSRFDALGRLRPIAPALRAATVAWPQRE